MTDRVVALQSRLWSTWVVALLAVAAPGQLLCGEPGGVRRGEWVRLKSGPEAKGEGFAITSETIRGELLSQDERTVTLNVSGRPLRILRPGTVLEGEVLLLDSMTLALKASGQDATIVVPRDAIMQVDVRRQQSRKTRGVLLGALAGAAAGALIGVATAGDDGLGLDAQSLGAAAGAVIGAPTGALLGFFVAPAAKWEHGVQLDKASVTRRPTHHRSIGFVIGVRF